MTGRNTNHYTIADLDEVLVVRVVADKHGICQFIVIAAALYGMLATCSMGFGQGSRLDGRPMGRGWRASALATSLCFFR